MAKVWKVLALLLVITALVWLTTMWRWQSAQMDPSGADVVLHMIVLPLVLTAALAGAVWGATRMRRYALAPLPAAVPVGTKAAPAATAAAERIAHFAVLGRALQVRAGTEWDSACAALASGECKPELDAALKDEDGMAVFTAPLPELDTAAVDEALQTIIGQRAAAEPELWAGFKCPSDMPRTLTLMGLCLTDLQETLTAQWPGLNPPPLGERNRSASAAPQPLDVPTACLRVAIPARWSAQAQQLASAWLAERLDPIVDAGLQAAGQSRAMAQNTRAAVQVHIHPVASAEAFWQLIDQQLLQWHRGQDAGLLLALAADSGLSEAAVQTLSAARQLFSGENQNGRVPGEGAAGLLLASGTWPQVEDTAPPTAWLYRASMLTRDKPADAPGRINAKTMRQAVEDALRASGAHASHVTHITTDADHRASRSSEVFETLQELLPQIDPLTGTLRLGTGCGDLGIARLLACAALAATKAEADDSGGLVIGSFDPTLRLAVLVTPPRPLTPPAAADGSPAEDGKARA